LQYALWDGCEGVTLRFEILGADDLKAIAEAFNEHADGRELRAELVEQFRDVTDPLRDRVKAAWKASPSKGHGTSTRARQAQPGLRSLLSRATRTEIRLGRKAAGVAVRTDGRRMPDGMKRLPHYAEGTNPRWRHPVFGNREVWVEQPPFPRFFAAVQPDETRARRAAEQAVESVLDKIAKAG
jgi:hypothetical protein